MDKLERCARRQWGEDANSDIRRGLPTTPVNVQKLNTDNFVHLKQTHQVLLGDSRQLTQCYYNYTKLY